LTISRGKKLSFSVYLAENMPHVYDEFAQLIIILMNERKLLHNRDFLFAFFAHFYVQSWFVQFTPSREFHSFLREIKYERIQSVID
jgi:hypothetical protein